MPQNEYIERFQKQHGKRSVYFLLFVLIELFSDMSPQLRLR